MTLTTPLALLLLVCLIPIIYLGLPRIRHRRSRDLVSLLVRSLIVVLVVLALAGAHIVRSANRLAVVFLVDASDSISTTAQEAQLDYMRTALENMTPDDEAAVVVFGANAVVERALSAVRELPSLRSIPVTSNTDLAEAIRIGLGLFPADAARRIVILSDGVQTVGDARAAAERAAATGVEISYVPFSRDPAPEVQITDVRVPQEVGANQEFDLSFTVQSESATNATITILASGAILLRDDVTLRAGENNYAVTLQSGDAGFRDFQVLVDPAQGDAFYQNNQLAAFSEVVGPPRVLLVAPDAEEGQYLVEALNQVGIAVDQVTPGQLPIGIAPLASYDSVILANVPATDLTQRRMQTLVTYVRDLGGGLVVVGGPESYAPGGYFQTPLEDALPVEMQIRDQQRLPQLTLAYVIDRSGSMGVGGANGIPNIELAKEAMIRSVNFLQPTDRAGVISFDTDASWIAEIQPVYDRLGLQALIGTLRASGGTDIQAGYNLAAQAMIADQAPRKHIILLTDGGAAPGNLVDSAATLYQDYDVTTSIISIGGGVNFLQEMAQVGGGNYHEVATVEQIPTIFASETVLASRAYIVEDPFVPLLSANSPIMNGITSAPPLLGYVASTPKQTSQVILRSPEPFSDPILATWQFGLGRAVAFTSDATARWASNWVGWDDYARFWSQVVQWTITETAENNVEARVVLDGEQARVVVDARDADGGFLNGLQLQTTIVDPELGAQAITLQQVAPGRYEAAFTPNQEGAYFLRLTGEGQDTAVNQTTGWVLSYSPEYAVRTQDEGTSLLGELAGVTQGRSLLGDPGAVFAHNLAASAALTPLAPWLLLLATLLLPFDIAVRRLLITRSDLQRLRQLLSRSGRGDANSERMSSLMGAKARAQQQIEQQHTSPSATIAALRERKTTRQSHTPEPRRPSASPPARGMGGHAEASASRQEEGTTASRLLDKRRERRQDQD
ncbi:MAG: VWA domain-containing protein [Anaerolineae bacterium]|nr:VWA domain-containing protein [Anaerolineae bacterium]